MGGHNNIPKPGQLEQQTVIPGSRKPAVRVLAILGPLLPPGRGCHLAVCSHGPFFMGILWERGREQGLLVSLFIRAQISSDKGPTLWPHVTLITSVMALSPNTVTLGVRLQCMNFDTPTYFTFTVLYFDTNIQSKALWLLLHYYVPYRYQSHFSTFPLFPEMLSPPYVMISMLCMQICIFPTRKIKLFASWYPRRQSCYWKDLSSADTPCLLIGALLLSICMGLALDIRVAASSRSLIYSSLCHICCHSPPVIFHLRCCSF